MANEVEQNMILRIVEPGSVRKLKLTSRPSSVEDLINIIKDKLDINYDFSILYEDMDFDGKLTTLTDIDELPQKSVIHIKLYDQSSAASMEVLSDVSSPERVGRFPSVTFPIPTFGFDVEMVLNEGNKEFQKNGTHITLTWDQRHDILEKMGAAIYGYKAYPSHSELAKAAKALVLKHPCLKERGNGRGYDSWINSLTYKLANVRTKMRKAGCQEVTVNAGKRSRGNPDGDSPHSNIKRPKRAEVNFLPNFPKNENAESLEQHRRMMADEMNKVDKNQTIIGKLMQITFALRRQKVVVSRPPVSEFMEEWPALKIPSEVYAEFQRITNKNLPNTFYAELDKITPRFFALLRQKASKTGKSAKGLADLFKAHDEQMQHDAITRRTTVLHALALYLHEDSSGIYIKCVDDMESPDLSDTAVGLLSKSPGVIGLIEYEPVTVTVILEGQEVISVGNFPDAFLAMFGLIYTLHLSYPKKMKFTFEFIQKVILGLEDGKLAPKLLSLKNSLA